MLTRHLPGQATRHCGAPVSTALQEACGGKQAVCEALPVGHSASQPPSRGQHVARDLLQLPRGKLDAKELNTHFIEWMGFVIDKLPNRRQRSSRCLLRLLRPTRSFSDFSRHQSLPLPVHEGSRRDGPSAARTKSIVDGLLKVHQAGSLGSSSVSRRTISSRRTKRRFFRRRSMS